jgi:hypothetical protein
MADMPPMMAKRLSDAAAETVELRKRVAELETERERVLVEKRAESEYPAVPGLSRAELVELVLVSKRTMSADAFGKLEQSLRASSALVAKGAVFHVVGHGGDKSMSDAYSQLVEIAKSIRKAQPALSDAGAMMVATQQNPELAKRYATERK